MKIKGISASPGIEIGTVCVVQASEYSIDEGSVLPSETARELEALDKAVSRARTQLEQIIREAQTQLGEEEAEMLEAQDMILGDEIFIDEIRDRIRSDCCRAARAVSLVLQEYGKRFSGMDSEYQRERIADLEDAGNRVIRSLLGQDDARLTGLPDNAVLFATELTPSETMLLDRDKVAGFVMRKGGKTSHVAIIARNMGMPAVVGCGEWQVTDGAPVIVDGSAGEVLIDPTQSELQEYHALRERYHSERRDLQGLVSLPATTRDGVRRVLLAGNLCTPSDTKDLLGNGALGVGLYRTEFLFTEKQALAGEEEQFEAYRSVAEAMAPHAVTIRTLDIGGDKPVKGLDIPTEDNPFLGWRAIRICLDMPDLMRTQLRAILRASHYGKVQIMYPMISGVQEVRAANARLREVMDELDREGIPCDRDIETGVMIETPAAAVLADVIMGEVDFCSVGTNDLTQYTLAVDRGNSRVAPLYDSLHPAVLRLLCHIVESCHRQGKQAGICGEMAGDPLAVPLLLAMGMDKLSVEAGSLLPMKKTIRETDVKQAEELLNRALELKTCEEIQALLSAAT